MLEAAYSLKDRAFAENFGTIILYAVVGTLFNWAIVGGGLFILNYVQAIRTIDVNILDCLIFAALISAVDPVAVLAIFQELGVNKMLYFMVFGESLLNDAVTVVMYTVLVTFNGMETVTAGDMGMGVVAFLVSSGCAFCIGTLLGLLTGFITKYTGKIRVVETTTLLGMAYLAYLFAELFHFSGIISIICCGLVQSHFAMDNISAKSYVTVQYITKVLSSVTESLIFIILGVMLVNDQYWVSGWSAEFSLFALILCIVARFTVVLSLTSIVNWKMAGFRQISREEQIIMAYGGLRGAVSFSLVFMLTADDTPHRNTLLCATYIVILFTVFVQGSTIKPLVNLLRIRKEEGELTLFTEIHRGVIENTNVGIEEICGTRGFFFWSWATHELSKRFLRPFLMKDPGGRGHNLLSVLAEVEIQSRLTDASDNLMGKASTTLPAIGSALFDELQMLDKSPIRSSTAAHILDAQDEMAETAHHKASMGGAAVPLIAVTGDESMESLPKHHGRSRRMTAADLRMSLTPLNRKMHYVAGNRNLRTEPIDQMQQQFKHLKQARRASATKYARPPPSFGKHHCPSHASTGSVDSSMKSVGEEGRGAESVHRDQLLTPPRAEDQRLLGHLLDPPQEENHFLRLPKSPDGEGYEEDESGDPGLVLTTTDTPDIFLEAREEDDKD